VIHRTFRSLDDPPKLVGFTIRQWAALIGASTIVLAVIHVAHLGAKPATTLCVFTIGLPAALTYVSESGGLQLGLLLRDMCRWRLRARCLAPATAADRNPRGVLIEASRERGQHTAEMAAESRDEQLAFWGRWE
jgi:hypothetical protein